LTTSVIIPIYNLQGYRLRNFEFVLQRCLESKADEVIVVEQIKGKSTLELPEHDRLTHILVDTELNYVHKTLICNVGGQAATGDYLIFNDVDIYVKLDEVIAAIDPEVDHVIKPFQYFAKFDEELTNSFISQRKVTAKNCSLIHDLGAGAIVIKRQSFLDIRGYDERYMGWGFEDKEFADRVTKIFDIKVLDKKGVHLFHEVTTPFEALDRNSALYRMSKKSMFINVDKYIQSIRSILPYIKEIKSRKVNTEKKKAFINNLTGIGQQPSKKPTSAEEFVDEMQFEPIKHICHVTAPALIPDKLDLFKREQLALLSYTNSIKPEGIELSYVIVTDSDYEIDFYTEPTKRNSSDVGDTKGLPYLKDLYDQAVATGADCVVYTNSDCALSPRFYETIANMKGPILEFHRMDVFGEIKNLNDLYDNAHVVHQTGVDGIAIRTDFWAKYRNKINFEFFIGEPHWDTSICGIFRRLGLSAINTDQLYHPRHQTAWNTANLSPAGEHNTVLYKEYLDNGLLESHILSVPNVDTSVVMVHYGHDPIRLAAIRKNFEMLQHQDLDVEYVFVEMVFDDTTAFPELADKPNFTHIQLPATDRHKNIWQKEAMMNIGAKQAKGEYIIFIDSDVHSTKPDWFRRIRNKLKDNPHKMVQGFRLCRDSEFPVEHSFVSNAAEVVFQYRCDLMHNPGLVWGITKNMLEINDYLNPYMIYGGGDSIFMYEYLGSESNKLEDAWIVSFDRINHIKREAVHPAIIDCVDDDIVHCNHGKVGKRNYRTRHYMTGYFTKELDDLVTLDENELLVWMNPDCPERKMCMKRYEMDSIHTVRDICTGILNES
jgi:cellulose synthase/poly-beta-1,6-N-acetylglucosamine synthase-like glycosyltransferase